MFLCGSKITFSVRYKGRFKKGYLKKYIGISLNFYFDRNEQQNTCLIQRSADANLYSYCTKFVDIYHALYNPSTENLSEMYLSPFRIFAKRKTQGGKSFERMNDVVLSDADSPDKFLRYASTRNTTR